MIVISTIPSLAKVWIILVLLPVYLLALHPDLAATHNSVYHLLLLIRSLNKVRILTKIDGETKTPNGEQDMQVLTLICAKKQKQNKKENKNETTWKWHWSSEILGGDSPWCYHLASLDENNHLHVAEVLHRCTYWNKDEVKVILSHYWLSLKEDEFCKSFLTATVAGTYTSGVILGFAS